MPKSNTASCKKTVDNPFQRLSERKIKKIKKGSSHIYGKCVRCNTDTLGYPTPANRNPLEIVVNASEGFIPLWDKETTLHWRFQEQSLNHLADTIVAKKAIRELLGKAILAWGSAVPIKFTERNGLWDFEISLQESDQCDINGCVLARAFFPDAGRHELVIYPRMFQESEKEQIETIAHEIGHIFGLRHFFAQVNESAWPAEVFGEHEKFSIMNYGANSVMTSDDKDDLRRLYQMAWAGQLTHINGTPIQLVKPFHTITQT